MPQFGGGHMNARVIAHLPNYGRAAAVGLAVGAGTVAAGAYAGSGEKSLDSPGKLAAGGVGFIGGFFAMGGGVMALPMHMAIRDPNAIAFMDTLRVAGFGAGAIAGAGLGVAAVHLHNAQKD